METPELIKQRILKIVETFEPSKKNEIEVLLNYFELLIIKEIKNARKTKINNNDD